MASGRQRKVAIGFMIAWLVFWAAGMIVVLFTFGGAVLSGDLGAMLFLLVWLAAASVGLVAGARNLRGLLFGEEKAERPLPPPEWQDGISDRPES
ncbi:MAG: hypothetical protein ABTQ27_12715 [Amaricoccus sp.]|uniref:hypothetical protein n=1 Tax=Amaricoccus sp. TaxID=1872485 RepID=UPI003315FC7D